MALRKSRVLSLFRILVIISLVIFSIRTFFVTDYIDYTWHRENDGDYDHPDWELVRGIRISFRDGLADFYDSRWRNRSKGYNLGLHYARFYWANYPHWHDHLLPFPGFTFDNSSNSFSPHIQFPLFIPILVFGIPALVSSVKRRRLGFPLFDPKQGEVVLQEQSIVQPKTEKGTNHS